MKTLHFSVSHWGLCQSQPNSHLEEAAAISPAKRKRLDNTRGSGAIESSPGNILQGPICALAKRLRAFSKEQTQSSDPAPRLQSSSDPLSRPPNSSAKKLGFVLNADSTVKNRMFPDASVNKLEMSKKHLFPNKLPNETALKLNSLYMQRNTSTQQKSSFAKIIDGYVNSNAPSDIQAFRINDEGFKQACSSQYKVAQALLYDTLLTESDEQTLPQLHKDLSQFIDSTAGEANLKLSNPEKISLLLMTAIQAGACLDHGMIFDNFQSANDDTMVKNDEFYLDPVWLCAQSSNMDALTALSYIGRDIDAPANKHLDSKPASLDTESFNHSVLYELCSNTEDYGDNVDLAKHLVGLGANFTKCSTYIEPPLMAAVRSGKANITHFFLQQIKEQNVAVTSDDTLTLNTIADHLAEPKRTLMLDLLNNTFEKAPPGHAQQLESLVNTGPYVEFNLEPECNDMCIDYTADSDEEMFQNLSGRSWM